MDEIASDAVLDEAYRWVCHRRRERSHNSDVWTLRWRWQTEKRELQRQLLAGAYRFDAQARVSYRGQRTDEHDIELWSARDALVLKAITIVLTRRLAPFLPKTCYHLPGHGGSKRAVCDVVAQLPAHRFVYRSDVKEYYANRCATKWDLRRGLRKRYVESWDHVSILVERND